MTVHVVMPDSLAPAAIEVLDAAGIATVRQLEPLAEDAIAVIGPLRSHDVAEALELTAPARVPLLAPAATWAGVTRDDEPGCEDAARHQGTVFRMVARDTEVARRIAAFVGEARVIAGDHEYGRQLDGQLALAGLRRSGEADVVVLCGLAGHPEVDEAAATGLPVIAFDGVQGADLPDLRVALAYPGNDLSWGARRAAELVVATRDAPDRIAAIRALGFDEHGDPLDPPVALWRGDALEREL